MANASVLGCRTLFFQFKGTPSRIPQKTLCRYLSENYILAMCERISEALKMVYSAYQFVKTWHQHRQERCRQCIALNFKKCLCYKYLCFLFFKNALADQRTSVIFKLLAISGQSYLKNQRISVQRTQKNLQLTISGLKKLAMPTSGIL